MFVRVDTFLIKQLCHIKLRRPCFSIALPISLQCLKDTSRCFKSPSVFLLYNKIASQAQLAKRMSPSRDFGKTLRVSCKRSIF